MNESTLETVVYAEADLEDAKIHEIAGGLAGVYTAPAPDREQDPNEDAVALFAINHRNGVLALADGVGGYRGGNVASRTAIEALGRHIRRDAASERPLRSSIIDGFESANSKLIDNGIGSATTFVVVELNAGTIRPYYVGDSIALVVGQRGKLKLQTVAHSPVGYAVESGVMDEEEAITHEHRHVVSNVVGSSEMHISLGASLRLRARDTLLLASDGLTDNLSIEEIVDIIRAGSLEHVLESLIGLARERMFSPTNGNPSKPDDVSFIVFRKKR